MARSRSGGGAYAVALVVMGCFWVVTLLFAIIFYTKIEEADKATEEAKNDLSRFIKTSETPRADAIKIEDGSSYFDYFVKELTKLENQVAAISQQLQAANLTATQADEQVRSRNNEITELKNDITELEAKARADLAAHQAAIERIEAARDALQQQYTALSQSTQTTITETGAGLRQQLQSLQDELDEAQQVGIDRNTQIVRLQQRIDELEGLLKANVLETRVTTADGEIVSVISNGEQMFINRGRLNGVMLGMTFEVYEPGTIISLEDGTNQLRGKATIEVFEAKDGTATCRVVRQQRNTTIDPGDLIANIVYDPEKTYTFYAYGYFDIERDQGPNDLDRIRNMIKQWNAVQVVGALITLDIEIAVGVEGVGLLRVVDDIGDQIAWID
ncbi:MAG: hypothetical protein AAGC44_14695, partial [Planctomycetota bacterium]